MRLLMQDKAGGQMVPATRQEPATLAPQREPSLQAALAALVLTQPLLNQQAVAAVAATTHRGRVARAARAVQAAVVAVVVAQAPRQVARAARVVAVKSAFLVGDSSTLKGVSCLKFA